MDEAGYQAKVRNTAVPAVYLILCRTSGEILLALRQNTGYQDGRWELPAGHVDGVELPTEAMVREVEEEIGIIINPAELKLVHTSYRPIHDKTGNRVDFVFQTSRRHFHNPRICETEKCAELRWFYPYSLPVSIVPHVREFIECWRLGIQFSELNVDWLKANGLYKL